MLFWIDSKPLEPPQPTAAEVARPYGPETAAHMNTSEVPAELRTAAGIAAREFFGEEGSLQLLGHGQTLTYRVTTSSGPHLLRLHSPRCPHPRDQAFSTPAALESECAWLDALENDTDLVVQAPLPSPTGGYVLTLPLSGDGEQVRCTALTWVEGELLQARRTQEQATILGELLATLHEHSRSWERPAGFERPSHDPAAWRDGLAGFDQLVGIDLISSADRALYGEAIDRCERELAPLAHEPDRIGLIHADLHGSNYVFHEGQARPIDFGLAGFGPWLYDVAECMSHLTPVCRRVLAEAYARRFPLAEGDLQLLEGYFVAALTGTMGHHAPNSAEHEYLAMAIPAWAPHVRRYVEGSPFLFEL